MFLQSRAEYFPLNVMEMRNPIVQIGTIMASAGKGVDSTFTRNPTATLNVPTLKAK